jgi:hypothetical protein
VERFTQALNRREVNRKALPKWIKSNLQAGIDYGQIHVVGKDKCRLAGDGRAHDCIDPRHWSKPSLWKPGVEKICGMLGLIPRFPNLAEYEKAALGALDVKVIILKCELHTGSGFVAAEGTGAHRWDGDTDQKFLFCVQFVFAQKGAGQYRARRLRQRACFIESKMGSPAWPQ